MNGLGEHDNRLEDVELDRLRTVSLKRSHLPAV
jgi:hypothetical protein